MMNSIQPQNNQTPFDPNDKKYKCCCGSVHVKTGTKVIAIVSLVMIALQFLSRVGSDVNFLAIILGGAIGVITCVMLLYGLGRDKPGYLVPYLVVQAIGFVLIVAYIILAIVFIAGGSKSIAEALSGHMEFSNSDLTLFGSILLVGLSLALVIQIWFFMVVFKCYMFLRDQERAKFNTTIQLPHQNQPFPATYVVPGPAGDFSHYPSADQQHKDAPPSYENAVYKQ